MRLEKEEVGEGRIIMHAYGAGGRGYELSWGVANFVGAMIMKQSMVNRSFYPTRSG